MNKIFSDAGLLLLRAGSGLFIAFGHGLGKLPPSEGFIGGGEKLGVPLPYFFGWMAGLSEFLGGLLVALGLFTRPAALFVAFTMATAAFLRHADDPFGTKEKALLYLVISLCIALTGSGKYSLGKVLFKSNHPLV